MERYDPERTARVLGAIVLGDVPDVAGRPRYGGRPLSWAALEDKVRIDEFWEAAGVRHASSVIVAAERNALGAAARTLDRGIGTVWAGDARDGIHGGASLTFWVESGEAAELAAARITRRLRPGAGDALPRGHPLQHPRDRVPGDRHRVSSGRARHTTPTGPSDQGGFLAFTPDRDRVARGPSVAPRAIDAFRVADEGLGVALGPLEPARSVR